MGMMDNNKTTTTITMMIIMIITSVKSKCLRLKRGKKDNINIGNGCWCGWWMVDGVHRPRLRKYRSIVWAHAIVATIFKNQCPTCTQGVLSRSLTST